ncbi:MAG: hypothetical protein ACLT7B_07675 [[Ruminococcus] torques]
MVFYEKGNECPPAENASRICVGSNDRGVGLVAFIPAIDTSEQAGGISWMLWQSAFYLEWVFFLFWIH